MFDLEFFNVVCKVLAWVATTPAVHFVNPFEFKLERSRNYQLSRGCIESSKIMSPELFQLHAYVKSTYPSYFGLTFPQNGCLAIKHNFTIYTCTS